MNTVLTAIKAIHKADSNELKQIIDAVKLQQTYLAKQSARTFSVGDAVQFTGRGNRTVVGTVTKVNPKTRWVRYFKRKRQNFIERFSSNSGCYVCCSSLRR